MTDRSRDTLLIYLQNGDAYGGTVLDAHRNPVDAHTGMSIRDAIDYLHQRGKSIDVEFHPKVDGLIPQSRGKDRNGNYRPRRP